MFGGAARFGPVRGALRQLPSSRRHSSQYEQTVGNLRINQDSRVIFQGMMPIPRISPFPKLTCFRIHWESDTIAYGTQIVGGVSPGKGGQTHLDLPVFNTVREAVQQVKPQVSAVFVPAAGAAAAIIEAIEAEVPLVVSVAEHIPVHDMLRVHEVLQTQGRTRLVGPNCPGIIAPAQCRVGIMPYRQYQKGCVGIVSKSGTLSYEAVGATSKAGLGQSIVMGMGGDLLPGTTLVDGLRLFFDDPETKGIIVIGEIGGEAELRAAEVIREYRARTANPKPIIAMVAGRTAPQGRVMGHAGAVLMPRDVSAADKAEALRRAGAVVVPHPGVMGETMKALLGM
ncbi:succinate-CoA ligase (alpha subunit) [Cordyceps militaris CM01]|uniref:Succinate-CoA ligase (Alpha subunit) n=1 Tax=Cordyceps militaris (strain CM01) TaxID=983644 RepID=G3JH43_CORMM|nr:succinate-CoA ligase (alpha subunit) [Cordyceps militaris CM01]EGX91599.1 succinate-CoA ligase (alpha subunit) [Cordyceps militaris CM01]